VGYEHLLTLETGESFGEVPPIFAEYKAKLDKHIAHWGYMASKEDYFKVLDESDIVVSTARHEFFGISVVEAIQAGCYPLCPNSLVYPEYLDAEFLFNTREQVGTITLCRFDSFTQLCF